MPAQPVTVQKYEVKFFLAPTAVLGPDGRPTAEAKAALGLAGDAEEYRVAFLDGPHLDFHTERWNVRFRDKAGTVEVSFKRRLPVYHDSVDGVVRTAARQGFDAHEQAEGYETEIEWGHGDGPTGWPGKKTLTLVQAKTPGGLEWPATASAAADAAAAAMPGKLKQWLRDGWAREVLAVARFFGPVRAARWTGKVESIDDELRLEVWTVRAATGGDEPVAEVSFKKKSAAKAHEARGQLFDLLRGRPGWLVQHDVLKTDLVLDRYAAD